MKSPILLWIKYFFRYFVSVILLGIILIFSGCIEKPPEGKIIFLKELKDGEEIWVMNTDGSDKRRLFKGTRIRDISLSVDVERQRILFESDSEIWLVDIDKNKKERIGKGGFPFFSSDNNKILFVSEEKEGKSVICIMDLRRREKRILVEGRYPRFSRDGKKILFFRPYYVIRDYPRYLRAYTMHENGTNITKLTEKDEGISPPAWYYGSGPSSCSVGEKKIVFEVTLFPPEEEFGSFPLKDYKEETKIKDILERLSRKYERFHIESGIVIVGRYTKILNVDGEVLRKIRLKGGRLVGFLGFSPDESKVLFEVAVSDSRFFRRVINKIGIINLQDMEQRILVTSNNNGLSEVNKPIFTPDGKSIVFQATYEEFKRERSILGIFGRGSYKYEEGIYIMKIEEGSMKRIAKNVEYLITPNPFLPDGKKTCLCISYI